MVFGQVQQSVNMKQWERALELFWYAVMFVGNAVHYCEKEENGKKVQVAWFGYTTFLTIWAAFKQYVLEASFTMRMPWETARQCEIELRREIFGYVQKHKVSFDEAFEKHGYSQLRRLFQYQISMTPILKAFCFKNLRSLPRAFLPWAPILSFNTRSLPRAFFL